MAASDSTSVAYIYKRMYADNPADVATREHPLQSQAPKKMGLGGSAWNYVVRYGNPQGISGTFSSAQSAVASSKGVQFSTTNALKYGYLTLDGPSMSKARAAGKQAFFELVSNEFDGCLEEMGDSLGFDLYRAGNGLRGRKSSVSSNTITLTVADDARNFKVGMAILASANADGSSPRTNTGIVAVTAVDEDAGTVTVDNIANIGSMGASDYLFRLGDPSTAVDGLLDIIPATAPVLSSDSFRGVDRGAHPRLLAGARITTASTFEEDIGSAAVKVRQSGGRSDICLTNPVNYWAMVRRQSGKTMLSDGGSATYGYESIKIATPAGVVEVISDPDCPTTSSWLGKRDTLEIRHLENEYIHPIDNDGNKGLRLSSADGLEMRFRSMSQLIIHKPNCWSYIAH